MAIESEKVRKFWPFVAIFIEQIVVFFVRSAHPGWFSVQQATWYSHVPVSAMLFVGACILVPILLTCGWTNATALMSAGLLGNCFSYVLHQGVLDYLQCGPFVTNLSDIFILGGIAVLIASRAKASNKRG
jgi:lipoprotein signal peptidase